MNDSTTRPELPSPNQDDLFGPLAHYAGFTIRAPGRHKVLAVFVFLLCTGLGVAAVYTYPIKYRAQATILGQRNPLMGVLSNPGMNREWDTPMRAARESVIRRQNLVALCEQTDLVRRYRARRAPVVRARDAIRKAILGREKTDEQVKEDLVDALESHMSVSVAPEGTATIAFTWPDPDIARDVVEAAVEGFLEARNSSEIGAMGEAIAILQGHDARIQKEIAAAIEQLDQKERALRIRSPARRPAAARIHPRQDEDLVRLQGMLVARRRSLADLEEFRQRRTAELQLQLAQQLAVYAPEHPSVAGTRQNLESLSKPSPQMVELRAEIAELEREVERRTGSRDATSPTVMNAFELELAAARSRVLETQDPRLEYERGQLEALLRRHAFLLERIDAARIELDTAQAAFQQRYSVITPPRRPARPIKRYGLIFVLGGFAGGLALACLSAATLDLLRGRIEERWQLEQGLDLPVLAESER